MSLRSPYPVALSGQLTLSFDGNGALANDPMIQFSNGQRTVAFTIAANSTNAVFSPPVSLLTGTVAGSITLTASFQGGPPNQQAGPVSEIPLNAPQVTSVVATQTGTTVTVRVIGYSTPRSVTNLTFSFEVRTASGVQKVDLTRGADPDFPNGTRTRSRFRSAARSFSHKSSPCSRMAIHVGGRYDYVDECSGQLLLQPSPGDAAVRT